MDLTVFVFLSSGLFLGWSLGANHLGNVFGTAVGTRMVRFSTAALICSVFVVLGAVISGSGPTQSIGKLGAVNALAGSFMTALAAGVAVYVMTRSGLPVSTTQAIVGAIIGWNMFSHTATDTGALTKIMGSWIAGPVIAAVLAVLLFTIVKYVIHRRKLHLLRLDAYTRIGLVAAGALGAYSLGANNIANVMGVFVYASPFHDLDVGPFSVSATHQLFLLGALAIAVGVYTYSHRVVHTVGADLLSMSPVAAWVVVVVHSVVLLMFASEGLESLLIRFGLPTIPLVPISSSEVVVGAVLGIGLFQGGAGVRWRVVGRIGVGWILTPFISGLLCFVGLFILQNVFQQQVYRETRYGISQPVIDKLHVAGLPTDNIRQLDGKTYKSSARFLEETRKSVPWSDQDEQRALYYAQIGRWVVEPAKLHVTTIESLSPAQLEALSSLRGRAFIYKWELADALSSESSEWRLLPDERANKTHNQLINRKLDLVTRAFESD